MSDTRLEALGGGVTAVISELHGFGTDALMLAAFAKPKKNDRACDLGSGCGILPLLWCRDGLCKSVTAFEIQENACEQLRETVKLNGLTKIEVVCGDLRQAAELLTPYSYDLVTMNPPYKAPKAGLTSAQEAALITRHEVMCSFSDVAKAAERLLRFGGRFCVCHRPERVADVICDMRTCGIEPKRIRMVTHKAGMPPNLILVEGKKGGKSGVVIEPELVLKDGDGNYTTPALEMYGLYNNG